MKAIGRSIVLSGVALLVALGAAFHFGASAPTPRRTSSIQIVDGIEDRFARHVPATLTPATGAIVAENTVQAMPPSDTSPPILSDQEQFRHLLTAQDRDPSWAPLAEQSLRAIFLGSHGGRIDVRCASSICEVLVPQESGPTADLAGKYADAVAGPSALFDQVLGAAPVADAVSGAGGTIAVYFRRK